MIEMYLYGIAIALVIIIVMLIAILLEVFVDTDMRTLKRNVKIKTLQAQEQVLSMKMQGIFEEMEAVPRDDPPNKGDTPNAIGYGVDRD